MERLRSAGVSPGHYYFPHCLDMKEMADPAFMARMEQGPVGFLTVIPSGPPAMGKSLGQWIVFCLVVSAVIAYVAGITLAPGADFMTVFRITGTIAFLTYGISSATNSIWKGLGWGVTARYVGDGLLYGLATGAAFGWLWPGA